MGINELQQFRRAVGMYVTRTDTYSSAKYRTPSHYGSRYIKQALDFKWLLNVQLQQYEATIYYLEMISSNDIRLYNHPLFSCIMHELRTKKISLNIFYVAFFLVSVLFSRFPLQSSTKNRAR